MPGPPRIHEQVNGREFMGLATKGTADALVCPIFSPVTMSD
jgi:hypothetical protein